MPDRGPQPTLAARIAPTGRGLFRMLPRPMTERPENDDGSDDEEEEEHAVDDDAVQVGGNTM